MDFLESAAILIPGLTGLTVTFYDGNPDILSQFENQYCFASQIQTVYTALGMKTFLESCSEGSIYELIEPMGTRLFAFNTIRGWMLLGPFLESNWHEPSARTLLLGLGFHETAITPYKMYCCKLPVVQRDYALKATLLVSEHIGGNNAAKSIKTIYADTEHHDAALTFSSIYADVSITSRRFNNEDRFIMAISRGETEAAKKYFEEFEVVRSNLRIIPNDPNDRVTETAVWRAVAREGAKRAGLDPVLIDSISQEYAQRMGNSVSVPELKHLMVCFIERLCTEIQIIQKSSYSLPVSKAISYMGANLSKQMTITEIAKAAGIDRHQLVKIFGLETGMTVKQYLAKLRCEIAADLLLDSEASVQEIAIYVGYPDNNYFAKVFKAHMGISPLNYRKTRWLP